MSIILDALKKSEKERQENKAAQSVSAQPSYVARSSKRSVFTNVLLLCFALIVLFFLYKYFGSAVRDFISQTKTVLPTSAMDTGDNLSGEAAPNHQLVGQPTPKNRTVADPSEQASTTVPTTVAEAQLAPASNESTNSPAVGESVTGLTPLPPRHKIVDLWQMPADFQTQIPELTFSFHVFSHVSEKRYIYINDRRVREGQMVTSHVRLRLITETGVILEKEGRFFHVSVVEEWQ